MAVINRYNQPTRSATFDPLSLQELAFAPSALRQREDTALASADELSAIDVPRLSQDEGIVTTRLGDLRGQVSNLSERLATEGYNRDLANELRKVRTQYQRESGPSGTLGRAQANYQAANQQWKAVRDQLNKQGATPEYVNRARNQFFSGYQGLRDETGALQEFSSGRVANYYDINTEAQDLFKQAETSGELTPQQAANAEARLVNIGGVPQLMVINRKTGQRLSNIPQLEAGMNYLYKQYTDPNTDRGFFASTAGLAPSQVGNVLQDLSRVYASRKYSQLPSVSTTFKNLPDMPDESGDLTTGVSQSGTVLMPGAGIADSEERSANRKARVIQLAKERGLNVDKYEDVLRIAQQKDTKALTKGDPGAFISGAIPRDTKASYTANNILHSVEEELASVDDDTVNTFSIDRLSKASGKSILEADKLKKGITETFSDYKTSFKGITEKEQEALDELTSVDKVVDYFYDSKHGLGFKVRGKDNDNKPIEVLTYLPSRESDKERIFFGFLSQIDPRMYGAYEERFKQ